MVYYSIQYNVFTPILQKNLLCDTRVSELASADPGPVFPPPEESGSLLTSVIMALCCLILLSSSSQLMTYDLDRGSGFPFRQRTVWHLPTLAEVKVKDPPGSTGSCLM